MIFPRAELETFGFDIAPSDEETLKGLNRLARLQHMYRAGYWSRLHESHVEQSFVERVFGEVFGYTTLLGSDRPGVAHEIMPKLYVPLARAFPDFALGHFRADQRETVVTGELKAPDADLDAPQGGNYNGQSPVQQAMAAAVGASAEWCVVSNTTEVRLYRVPDLTRYERVNLLEIVSPLQFRRAYVLFSRRSLLGISGQRSPLTRLYSHLQSGESMLVPAREDRVRLVQRVRPQNLRFELPFARISGYLEKALAAVPAMNVMSGQFLRPKLQDDQLVFDRTADGGVWQRITMLKSGLVVCSYPLPLGTNTAVANSPIPIDPAEVAMCFCDMIAFGIPFFHGVGPELIYEWSLEDLSVRARSNDGRKWTRPTAHVPLTCQAGVTRTAYPETAMNTNAMKADTVVERITEVLRELFFPFEGNDDNGHLCRLEPTRDDVRAFLTNIDSFKLFS